VEPDAGDPGRHVPDAAVELERGEERSRNDEAPVAAAPLGGDERMTGERHLDLRGEAGA
jgi:hypothetical protein